MQPCHNFWDTVCHVDPGGTFSNFEPVSAIANKEYMISNDPLAGWFLDFHDNMHTV